MTLKRVINFFICCCLLCFLLLPWQCTRSASGKTVSQPALLVTIQPYCLLARELAGTKLDIDLLIPANASPHTFSPTPTDIIKWEKATLILANGLNLEQAMAANLNLNDPKVLLAASFLPQANLLLSPAEAEKHTPEAESVNAEEQGTAYAPEEEYAGPDHNPDGEEHVHGAIDPHIWLDPENISLIATGLCRELVRLLPENQAFFQANLAHLVNNIKQLDNEILTHRASLLDPGIVTFHNSFTYFLQHYRIETIAVVEKSPGKETTPRDLLTLGEKIRSRGVKVIFTEPELNPKAAQILATEFDLQIAILDPLGQKLESRTITELIRQNWEIIASFLN